MIKYIVYWVLSTTVPTACPDAVTVDELGRTSYYGCLVFHARTETENKSKSFDSKKEAVEFFEYVKSQQSENWSMHGISEARLDSLTTGMKIETESEYR